MTQIELQQQWKLLTSDSYITSAKLDHPIMHPLFIPGLYQDIAFPRFSTYDGLDIVTDDLNGALKFNDIVMTWSGYASKLYDGQLGLKPVSKDAKVSGTNNGTKFMFEGNQLVREWSENVKLVNDGTRFTLVIDQLPPLQWPGFIAMYN